ncbi:XK-related 8-like protein [Labeo rohita]|uniref:XK-related protein n=1 Tax=Labeo rohita TaxID=84645 RepID=A0A498MTJ4_LABRO|nr:XK-related 8-like protein [Labeo rohita]
MEESFPFRYTLLEYLFTLVGLVFCLLDIALDIWTVVSFYQDGAYVYMAVMIFLLLVSSVLLQVFSWVWYSDSLEQIETKVEKFADRHLLIKPFHFLQLGVYLREYLVFVQKPFDKIWFAGVIETSTVDFIRRIKNFRNGVRHSVREDGKLKYDFLMLRLFEAFSENIPQLTLILSRILQRGELELIAGMHVHGSKGCKMSSISTGVYFLWNLLLIIPRVTALALFCSVLPCFIIAHFLSLWMLLVLVAWSQKTDHMKSPGWEWLYRAAVGLIWYAGVIETSTRDFLHRIDNFRKGVQHSIREDVAVNLKHDLRMLLLFEAFSESAPQLTLMMSVILQRGQLQLITGLKFLTSAAAIASSVALYHRSMRIYLPEKSKMSWISTGVYFLWNLLLIIPRVTALALFCSVLPCFIIAHFLSIWMLLVLVAWRHKTNYMEHPGWEWLYRAAVGLIWYFSWFNVSTEGKKLKMVLYYIFMALDTMLLLGLWCWKVFEYAGCWSSLNPYVVIPTLLGLYVVGILVKMIYYKWCHPNCDKEKTDQPTEPKGKYRRAATYDMDIDLTPEDVAATPPQPTTGVLQRSRTMAANFYF